MRKTLLPLTLALLLLGTMAFAALQTDRLNRANRVLEEISLHALSQSAEELQALTLDLEKLLVAGTASRQAELLHAVALAASDVQQALASLPLSHGAMADTLVFIGSLQRDASDMLPALTQASLTPTQRRQLAQSLAVCSQLSGQLSLARSDLSARKLSLAPEGNVFSEDVAADERPLEILGSAVSYPQAEVHLPTSPKGLPGGEVTREEARAIARDFVGEDRVSAVEDAPDASGVLPAYGVTVESGGVQLNMEITRQGGKVLWMMPETASFPMTQSPESCESAALAFLVGHGFGEVEAVHRQLYDGLCVISAVPVQEGVLLYPDLITVQVRMDTLQVVGLEARSYWTYHVSRDIPEPSVTREQARESLTDHLESAGERLCIIPDGSGERLCWQCTAISGGETYYIYLDAQTGQEVTIRKLIPLENGTTAA